MVFKEYEDPAELKRLQELSETVLAEFDRVCRELDIPYFAYAGTALGAVRHGGFIPWDDDIDVAMTRDAYERFLANAPALLDERFEVANTRTEPDFTSPYSYLTLKGTCCIPDFYRACPYKKPISIDVFPFDKVSNDPAVRKRQMRGTWLWGRLMFLRATPEPYLAFDGVKRTLVLAICRCAHGLLKLLGQTPPQAATSLGCGRALGGARGLRYPGGFLGPLPARVVRSRRRAVPHGRHDLRQHNRQDAPRMGRAAHALLRGLQGAAAHRTA